MDCICCHTPQRSQSRFHTQWRYQAAVQIASELDMERLGVQGIYLFGSVESGKAGTGSDIDLIFHIDSSENQKRALLEWLKAWDLKLCEIFKMITGKSTSYMLDIHLVDDSDIKRKTCFAQKIHSVYEPVEPLRKRCEPL
ncbi:nucleotidyltransferase domain-containing protein [Oscillospiraceae bacterium MB08-C2-2]|nr:nucleotidyltransferase domain-containing protein [Oscillospiraceae bacterium MB08-C2-2]